MSDLLVGLDIGTTSIKAGLTDLTGNEVAGASQPMLWKAVSTGAETTLPEIQRAAWAALHQLLHDGPAGRVVGIGITGIAEAGVLLDAHDDPLTPIIAWHDSRGGEAAERIAAELGRERFSAATGLPVSATPTIAKLGWLRSDAERFGRAHRWLGVPEVVAHLLGASPVADLSLACRTGLLELATRTWWAEATSWLAPPRPLLAEVAPSGTPIGSVTCPDVSARLRGAVVTVAGHDHLTAAFGAGAAGPGDVFDSCGTAEALIAVAPPLTPATVRTAVDDGLTVSWHVVPDRQALVAAATTGLFLGRVRERLGRSVAELDQLDRDTTDGAGDDRLTELDADLVFSDSGADSNPADIWKTATDAATAQTERLLGIMRRHGAGRDRLVVTGGWTNSTTLLTAKRSRLGPLVIPQVTQAGARGAALMAGLAAGVFPTAHDVPRPDYGNSPQPRLQHLGAD